MIFADKLIKLRKKAGWTQEELAEMMNVSRQSIAKWEGMQSIPELAKIVKLSELFGVSTDYLLKDEIESFEKSDMTAQADDAPLRRVDMEEAHSFLAARKEAARPIALGVLLCILSPVALIFLSCMSESAACTLSENAAEGLGMIALILLVTTAVVTFILVGNKNARYAYLEKEQIDTAYGVEGLVKEQRAKFKPTYERCNIIGVVVCILSILPIFISTMVDENDPVIVAVGVCLLFVFASIGVFFFVRVGVVWASFEKLLQTGDYSVEKKREHNTLSDAISGAYWLIATAVYLAVSFRMDSWISSWIVWVIAGLLYPALLAILRACCKTETK